jgi:hypothetical protein
MGEELSKQDPDPIKQKIAGGSEYIDVHGNHYDPNGQITQYGPEGPNAPDTSEEE